MKKGTTVYATEFELCVAVTTQKYDWLIGVLTICYINMKDVRRLARMFTSLSENRKL